MTLNAYILLVRHIFNLMIEFLRDYEKVYQREKYIVKDFLKKARWDYYISNNKSIKFNLKSKLKVTMCLKCELIQTLLHLCLNGVILESSKRATRKIK